MSAEPTRPGIAGALAGATAAPTAGGWRAALRAAFRVPPAGEAVRDWHVAPAVDVAAYHLSWLWLLAPLLLVGDRHPGDYFAGFALLMTVNFVHRHFTLPYVYLDRQVFSRHPWRFTLVPLALIALFLATPAIEAGALPARLLPGRDGPLPGALVVTGLIFAAGAWNFWHVQMQKFGILRLYAAKARSAERDSAPRWADRLLLLGWLPFLILYLGTRYRDAALTGLAESGPWLEALLAELARARSWLEPPLVALAAGGVAAWVRCEWRANRLRNRPRLSMALGTLALNASFLLVNPIKVYMAYAFGHGIEYLVFVWAFQRRHYRQAAARRTQLGRLHARPGLLYPALVLGLAVPFLLLRDWGGARNLWNLPERELGGATLGLWVFYWSVYQSFVHFYYDGFLWKARRRSYRADL